MDLSQVPASTLSKLGFADKGLSTGGDRGGAVVASVTVAPMNDGTVEVVGDLDGQVGTKVDKEMYVMDQGGNWVPKRPL
ncbi:hypothetical protein F8O06_01330 [Pseudoclavibacter sp. CFCC 14310]|uniref:hypothetical protein n=1 Tax=Pseudoclavibacter sp. CFCC 14310 TaxID=2615180 RepID=UPI001300E7D6|nr:hypothetical protein [Pseudoclavibacter sp. CFCC 14310]KAB1647245.1 hypothetical protein F8O06_01330 [Pseudoclavibacter sp. CFCC 14310]